MAAKFGPGGNSESFYAEGFKSTLQAPAWVRARGLDAYEYQGGNGITASAKTLSAIGEAAAGQGISMSLHTPYYISLSSEFEEKRARSLDYIAASADACEALGARIMVVHTGSAAKLSRETAMAYAADTVEKACVLLADKGSHVRMGLETMGKQNQLGTLDEVLRLCGIAAAAVVALGLFLCVEYMRRPYCYIDGQAVYDKDVAMRTTVYLQGFSEFADPEHLVEELIVND